MSIPTQSYESVHTKYSAALIWLASLGVSIGPGRTSYYARTIEYWKDAYKTASATEGKAIFPDFVNSMFEVYDFIDIYESLKGVPFEQLASIKEKLQKAVNGPINAAEETPQSTAARNFLFEAALAARAHRPDRGLTTIFEAESDTGVRIESSKLWIECKRVTTADKLEANARKASRQLESVLRKRCGSGHRGIVAMDVSKIMNAGDKIFVSPTDSALIHSVNNIMDQFIKKYSPNWERVYERRDRKIIGTILRLAFMATSEGRNILVHASQWGLNPRLGISKSDDQVLRRLVTTLKDVA